MAANESSCCFSGHNAARDRARTEAPQCLQHRRPHARAASLQGRRDKDDVVITTKLDFVRQVTVLDPGLTFSRGAPSSVVPLFGEEHVLGHQIAWLRLDQHRLAPWRRLLRGALVEQARGGNTCDAACSETQAKSQSARAHPMALQSHAKSAHLHPPGPFPHVSSKPGCSGVQLASRGRRQARTPIRADCG